MDSERFDRWTKLLAQRMPRRTVAAALGVATVASLSSPRWALGQDDDDDQNTDDQGGGDDQNTDDQGGGDDQNPDDQGGGDDQGGDDQGGDDDVQVGKEFCEPVSRCKAISVNYMNGNVVFYDVGPIPGGPYPQYWKWDGFSSGCKIVDHTEDELSAMCRSAYPRNPQEPLQLHCEVELGCAACCDCASLLGCK